MAYIRDKSEELTGFQNGEFLECQTDFQCDFAMAYRLNDTTAERVKKYKDNGYEVHLMTGISWGHYQDYLFGEYDGREHLDEAQEDRFGNKIVHGKNVPYMVPTIAFADYLTEKLKAAVDAGVLAIHVEEPEFWDRAGYSPAFKREYELYYKEPYIKPHESADAYLKASRLKAYLYKRTIDRVGSALKEYAAVKYNRRLRFYVPTHSLLNYTQWKIISPEGLLADISAVDGCIAQVWTGTSRTKNWYEGRLSERTFETAYLEYGVMQELNKCTGRKMWFLHDPIEDNPAFDWDDYRKNYLETVTASLLHTRVNSYEICPWPSRIFNGKYPSGAPDAVEIPPEYSTLLNNTFQTLGDITAGEPENELRVGVLLSDTALYQRTFPDSVKGVPPKERSGTVLFDEEAQNERFKSELFNVETPPRELMYEFAETAAFPQFYGLSMPLLKYGLPIKPVLLDNVRRYNGYLDDMDVLVLSYEFMKPEFPDVNNALAAWVRNGGTLIYIGDGSDPFHSAGGWWSGSFGNPAEHLFEMLGVSPANDKELFEIGKGKLAVWLTNPAKFCFSKKNADEYRGFFKTTLDKSGKLWDYQNSITEQRGTYIVSAVLDESVCACEKTFNGLFSDMYSPTFEVITEKTVLPGENTLLFDYSKIASEDLRIIGTSVRIFSLDCDGEKVTLTARGASRLFANIRLRVMFSPASVFVYDSEKELKSAFSYDEKSRTVLVSFENNNEKLRIEIIK